MRKKPEAAGAEAGKGRKATKHELQTIN